MAWPQMLTHVLGSTCSVHQTFQQGVAGQPVSSVHARARHLSGCVETGKGSLSTEIGAHTAHGIVRCWTNGNQLGGNVDVVLHACGVDGWKASAHAVGMQVGESRYTAASGRFTNSSSC